MLGMTLTALSECTPSGKTTSLAEVSERLRSRGFGVYVVPEAATILFTGGATFQGLTPEQVINFQAALLRTQIALEDNFFRIAQASSKPSVLLCDRGVMDGRAYMTSDAWNRMLADNTWDPVQLRDERYDTVIHMVTAADGAESFYQLENNAARSESVTEARDVDRRTQEAWVGHPHLHIIDNSTGFREKIDRVFSTIGDLVGVHTISKREVRKFLVSKHVRPRALDIVVANLEEFDVEQTFLERGRKDGVQESVRRRGRSGSATFVHKVRRPVGDGKYQETKRQITNREYISLLANADPARRTVRMKRQCFLFNSRYFVLDTILNVEPVVRLIRTRVENMDHDLELPQWISIEREVTQEPEWSTYAMSTRITPARMKWPMTEPDLSSSSSSGLGTTNGRDSIDIASSF